MNKPKPKPRHPEAPDPGDEVMYVDLSREKLENLYNDKPTTPYKVRGDNYGYMLQLYWLKKKQKPKCNFFFFFFQK